MHIIQNNMKVAGQVGEGGWRYVVTFCFRSHYASNVKVRHDGHDYNTIIENETCNIINNFDIVRIAFKDFETERI